MSQAHTERPLKKYDLQIVKTAIRHLCEEENRFESVEKLQHEAEVSLSRRFRSSLLPLFKSFSNNFYIDEVEDSKIIRPKTTLQLCPQHCGKHKNCERRCNKLHICKFFLLSDSCKISKTKCHFGHDVSSAHNQQLLAENNLAELDIEKLRNLYRNPRNRCQVTRPIVCRFYNEATGCRRDSCASLHICKQYVTAGCKFGRRCRKSHDILDSRVKELLAKFGINTKRCPKDILADLRVCFREETEDSDDDSSKPVTSRDVEERPPLRLSGMQRAKSNPCLTTRFSTMSLSLSGSQQSIEQPEVSSTVICIYFLRGNCRYEDKCDHVHKSSMYQWQFRNTDDEWIDFRGKSNVEIEEKYCDVNINDCQINFGRQNTMRINFEKMTAKKRGTLCDVRRLSTESTAVQKFQPLATEYKWYWEDHREIWIIYGEKNVTGYSAMLDSDSLEMNYQENPTGQMKFKTSGHDYILDFQKMVQKNVVHKTERAVRRRPVFVNTDEIEARKKKSADTGRNQTMPRSMVVPAPLSNDPKSYIPPYWSFDRRKRDEDISNHFNLSVCQFSSPEASQLKRLFFETMPKSYKIVSIKRIENGELWMNFVSKREKMRRKNINGTVTELQLFHGTNEDIVDAICRQGFDFRFSGSKTGHLYGKGSYFAKMALTADSYTDLKTSKHMFVVRVLAGEYAVGETTFVRPPPRDLLDPFELYDSCVDNVRNPNIFVIFTFDQVYPEYLIEYQKAKK